MTSHEITLQQIRLNKYGFSNPKLEVDGVLGKHTLRAMENVEKFQKKHGLKPDGIIGPLTIAKLTQKKPPKPIIRELSGFSICIDPGHGGTDPGAVDGKSDDNIYTKEADLTLKAGLMLQEELIKLGARVTITRGNDTYPSLQQRCDIANNFKADIFISIHCNAAGSPSADGIETLYKTDAGKKLAQPVQEELIKSTGAKDRGTVFRNGLWVLNQTKMPSILIELGFITNVLEEAELNDTGEIKKRINAIVKGVVRYRKGK